MRTQTICFPNRETLCVFPDERLDLEEAISELRLDGNYPVIVLIGGGIDEKEAQITRRAIQTISNIAEEMSAVVICGGTDMGVMAEIGVVRSLNDYNFPLIGIAPEALVTWEEGPKSTKFLWWGTQRWQLEPHFTHFILVPGDEFGDESPWIVDAATLISEGHRAMTILINGGDVSRKDIDLSLEHNRPVLALSCTGRLADELSRQPMRNKLISVAPANSEERIRDLVQVALAID